MDGVRTRISAFTEFVDSDRLPLNFFLSLKMVFLHETTLLNWMKSTQIVKEHKGFKGYTN